MGNIKVKKRKNPAVKTVIILSIVLGVVVVGLVAAVIALAISTGQYKTQLSNVYMRNYYELINNVEDIEVGLTKLVATNSLSTQQEVLQTVNDASKMATANLTTLPISSHKISHITSYINTLSGYSTSLMEKTGGNQKLDSDDLTSIENLHSYCQIILYDLNDYIADLKGKNSILKQVKYSDGDTSEFSGGMEINSNTENLPTLIYDGPFSDSVINKEIKGLGGVEVTSDQAKSIIDESFSYFGDYTIEYDSDTNGKFSTYNFIVENDTLKLYVQVTKMGGMVLSINALEEGDGNNDLSANQCENLAHNFATFLGFENMYSVWYQETETITYINLAPIVNGVIHYPDLIKVKVDKELGMVTGWEATNYAYNHTKRANPSPSISFEEGEALLSNALEVKERNLCVIPNKYVGESFAYEYVCEWKDFTYYVYLDINTGEELNIMRVIETNNGSLLF